MDITAMGLLSFLIWALILVAILYVVKLVMDMIPIPPQMRIIAFLIVGLIALILLLAKLGVAI